MKIKLSIFILITAAIVVCSSLIAYAALTSLTFNQNPSVTSTGVSFSTNPSITQGSDQTSLWTWNDQEDSFTATITLTNNGNSPWTPVVTSSPISNWTFSTSALSSIAMNSQLQVTMTMHYTTGNPPSGPIGSFTVTIA